MTSQLRSALAVFILLTIVTGMVYPLLVFAPAQGLFPNQANGSIVEKDGKKVGSALIGQEFTHDIYFWGRPSATTPKYNAGASSGSNQGPLNADLLKDVKERVEAMRKAHPDQTGLVPVDLVTASASGLDPHISPAAAEFQIQRVALARRMAADRVQKLVQQHTESRTFGILGEPRVNVLRLNLALDALGDSGHGK